MKNYKELPDRLENIDVHFKISAGPGAGKTTWLVEHIKNVLSNSDRLGKTKKIACITYTRIGADTVEKKVKKISGTNRLDVGTIHSFLYRNVVKPFSYLIEKDNDGNDLFNIKELSGHIENRPNHDRISSWANAIGKNYRYLHDTNKRDSNGLTNFQKTAFLLKEFEWGLKEGNINFYLKKNYYRDYQFPTTKLFEYKLSNWRKGIMHHEDVLYFTHYIFKKEPRVIEFISNKFPYLFLDEFQDTTPLQSWIIKEIANKGTIIGVIGDSAQSIFEFAGAKRSDFVDFSLPNIELFKKSKNYRSNKTIINFLNNLRKDIEQEPKEDAIIGDNITILIGDATKAIEHVKQYDSENFSVLCRYNKDVSRLKKGLDYISTENLIDILYKEDSNHKRPVFIHSLIKAYDFYEKSEYKAAIHEIKKHLKTANIEGVALRKIAIEMIEYLAENKDYPISEIYNFWHKQLSDKYAIKELSKLGKIKDIHKNNFIEFLPFIKQQTKISDKIRTIHQAKGDEFNTVLVCLFDKMDKNNEISKSIDKILDDYIFRSSNNIGLDNECGEQTRLCYVAVSRAQKKLFINIPRCGEKEKAEFEKLSVQIESLIVL